MKCLRNKKVITHYLIFKCFFTKNIFKKVLILKLKKKCENSKLHTIAICIIHKIDKNNEKNRLAIENDPANIVGNVGGG